MGRITLKQRQPIISKKTKAKFRYVISKKFGFFNEVIY